MPALVSNRSFSKQYVRRITNLSQALEPASASRCLRIRFSRIGIWNTFLFPTPLWTQPAVATNAVMVPGAIQPQERFNLAFDGGADFICAGMFDVQGIEDALITKKILSGSFSGERTSMA